MNDTLKSLERTYNQRDIREREGLRARTELAVIDDERRGERSKRAQQPSAELSW
jgi:hypothetical protein